MCRPSQLQSIHFFKSVYSHSHAKKQKTGNSYAKELNALLITFSLTPHVQRSTHSFDHTLDLVITISLNISITVKDLALSDHFSVLFDVFMTPNIQNRSMTVIKRVINDHTSALFEQALPRSLLSDYVDELLNKSFEFKIANYR